MTKQTMVVDIEAVSSPVSKPNPPPSTTSRGTPSESATRLALIVTPTEANPASKSLQSDPGRLKCRWELLSEIIHELLPVIEQHFKTVGLNGAEFNPDWDYLFSRERVGDLGIWTARTEGGAIVGYAVCMGSRGMFSHSAPMCCVEAIWLDPAWRNGRKGIRFIKSMVNAVKVLGVAKKIRIFSNDDYDVGEDGRSRVVKAFRAAGFRQTGTIMELDF